MAKKTKTARKKSTRKASKKAAPRSSGKTTSRKRRPTAAAKKRVSPAAAQKGKKGKKVRPATVKKAAARTKVAEKASAAEGAAPKKSVAKPTAAERQAVAKPATTAGPVDHGGSVIRIKTNAKRPRPGRGKSANSVNHRAKAGPMLTATSQDPIQFPEEARRFPKTHLSAKELREFRLLLLTKRAELCGDVERLTAEAFHQVEEGGNERSAMPIHMADLGSDNWEQDFTLGLIDTERSLVTEIDQALQRIDDRTFGICLATHNKISLARLRAKPWAKYCIEYARAREEGRAY